jgi:hypothetical protein
MSTLCSVLHSNWNLSGCHYTSRGCTVITSQFNVLINCTAKVNTHARACTRIRMHSHTPTHKHTRMYARTHARRNARTHTRTHTYMYIRTCVDTCIKICSWLISTTHAVCAHSTHICVYMTARFGWRVGWGGVGMGWVRVGGGGI